MWLAPAPMLRGTKMKGPLRTENGALERGENLEMMKENPQAGVLIGVKNARKLAIVCLVVSVKVTAAYTDVRNTQAQGQSGSRPRLDAARRHRRQSAHHYLERVRLTSSDDEESVPAHRPHEQRRSVQCL